MPNTHINTYIKEVEEAYKEAVRALGAFYDKVDALKVKYASHIQQVADAVGQTVPEIEALVPATKPALDAAESEVKAAETAVNQVTQTEEQPSTESKDSKAKS